MAIWTAIVNYFVASVLMGTTLMYGTLGEIITEKSGNMNLGVEGLIYMGGAGGLIAPWLYEQAAGPSASPVVGLILALLAGFLVAAFGSLIFSFLTITLRANQNVTGLALTIFGVGFWQVLWRVLPGKSGGTSGDQLRPGWSIHPQTVPGLFVQYPGSVSAYLLLQFYDLPQYLYRSRHGLSTKPYPYGFEFTGHRRGPGHSGCSRYQCDPL